MSNALEESNTPATSVDTTIDSVPEATTPTTSQSVAPQDNESAADSTTVEEQKKTPLPSLKDLPSLVSKDAFTKTPVSWGPNMKPVAATLMSQTFTSSSSTPGPRRMRSTNIQESFTLDLQSQLSITKPELSRIVLSIKQSLDVSIESTLSKNSRTFLISGVADNVHSAKRELIKKLTKPINDRIQIPTRCKAAVIGSGGKTIREISNKFEVKVNVGKEEIEGSYDEDLDDTATDVSFFGDFESVNLAKAKIMQIVKEETKNATIKVSVTDSLLLPFVQINSIDSIPGTIKCQFFKDTGDIVISGLRDDAKQAKITIQKYLDALANTLTEQKVKIPTKFQFLIDANELKEKFNVTVTFPTAHKDDFVSFAGEEKKVKEAISFARASSKAYVVDSLDIARAHSKNIEHAKNLVLYFMKYNALKTVLDQSPEIQISLPSVEELVLAENDVNINISAKSEDVAKIKAARKDIIGVVNGITPEDTLTVTDLDYDLFHKNIKQILSGLNEKIAFIQLGDYIKGNDSVILMAITSDEDFKPTSEEIKETLQRANGLLNPLREKLNSMSTKVYDLDSAKQEELLSKSSVTLPLIMEDISNEDGNVQFKLHTPENDKLTVRGDEKAVKLVNKAINLIIESPSKKSKITVEVPSNTVSRLIGNKGSNLQNIKDKFDVNVDVPPQESNSKDKQVEITLTGLEYNLNHAKKFVLAEAKKWADIVTKQLVVPAKYYRNLMGPRGSYRTRLQEKYSVFINFPTNGDIVTVRGPSRGVKQAYEELNSLLDFEMENGHKATMQVPAEHVPRVIGKNGDIINDIRAEFGVEMDFLQKNDDEKVKETGLMDLEIVGSRQAIKEAQAKVQQIVSEASDYTNEVLTVDRKYHRTIVGPGGRTLREIISKAGGDEIRNKNVDIPNVNSESDVITVQGPKSFVSKVVKEINKIVEEGENSITRELDIPKERQGALVGPGGVVRRQLETEFNVVVQVPNKDKTGPVTLTGLPENIEKAENKIINEILKDNFDVELEVPAAAHEFVSERGALIQKLRIDESINIKHGNSTKRATKLNRAKLVIPLDRVYPATEEEKSEKVKVTIEELSESAKLEEGNIPWRLTYEPIDISYILADDEETEAKEPKKNTIDEAKKKQALETATKIIEDRVSKAPAAKFVGYVWVSDVKRFNKIIGPGGSNIKQIREATGALINVPRKSDAPNDVVYIRGTKEGVEKAAEMVVKSLKN
ncbi:hypothetical protein KAFR_0A01570 [Kazachstania africana CBS 2517]|uniref:K Homology domain-containing protein n=1 Tax=Kazachstania africana (strain ATCC 22294 / BCRC 22015 / CBS 2517 / CECT 1963 / NBRC 1671 / NRRL Y-8276) TaxID=1071382 RepID=H2AMJ5_KAZAF|nr:hypothetical protein KAFR_0A01570 [Kazachstania africana CBS 2517]CCF55595.1 hypothetical protein KAFR_0A01570 [Kazachstania africana CBS 2517]